MIFEKDYFDNLVSPEYALTKADGTRIGDIVCTSKRLSVEFNAPDEISFETPMYINGGENPVYAEITEGKLITAESLGVFAICSINTKSEGQESETKAVTAKSLEVLLGQKYLELFTVNMGTTESIDSVSFYDPLSPGASLLSLVLEKCPDWSIGRVSPSLCGMQRSFEVTRQDIYSFLTGEVSEAFGCLFVFDTLSMTVNAYRDEDIGEDTDIYVSYDNLLKSTDMSCSMDDIKTCLTVLGADDLSLREVNMGCDKIYNLDFFHSREYMSDGLYDAYGRWKEKWTENTEPYAALLSEYRTCFEELDYEQNLKMPSDPESTDWTQYGLTPLQEKKAVYEQRLSLMMTAGQGNPEHAAYRTDYLPAYNALQAILARLHREQEIIAEIESRLQAVKDRMNFLSRQVDMNNCFTEEQLKELTKFIREDQVSSSNYVVTDAMTESERLDMLKSMLEYGKKELQRLSQPQLQFGADMANLFLLRDFDRISDKFDTGNYIHILIRDDYIVKARILKIELDFQRESGLSVTFGNVNRLKSSRSFTDVSKALKAASGVSTSVSFHSSHWNKANREASAVAGLIEDGLLSQGKYLSSGGDSQLFIDSRGIFLNTVSGEHAGRDSIFLGGGRILFTPDNWKTVSMSVGRVDLTVRGEKKSVFGTVCDVMLGGYIVGSVIDGNTIYVGGNDSDGKIIMYDKNGAEAGRWDVNGLVLPSDTTIRWTNVTDTEHVATKDETVPAGEVSSYLSTEAGDVTIGGNRLSILSDNLTVRGSGEIDATGTFKSRKDGAAGALYEVMLSGSRLKLTKNGSSLGTLGFSEDPGTGQDSFLLAAGPEAGALALGLPSAHRAEGHASYYYLNNGLNPLGRTERHVFDGNLYVSDDVTLNRCRFRGSDAVSVYAGPGDGGAADRLFVQGSLWVQGDIQCTGAKNRVVSTKNHGNVSMNALETAGAYFSDIGSGAILSGGRCYIYFDPVFAETVEPDAGYQVFLTPTGAKKISHAEKKGGYFIVHGEDGATFDWMLVCRQRQYAGDRMEQTVSADSPGPSGDDSVFYGDSRPGAKTQEHMASMEYDYEKACSDCAGAQNRSLTTND